MWLDAPVSRYHPSSGSMSPEDVRRWLMEMKAATRQPRCGIDVDLTDPRHQQRLLIILVGEVRLLLLRRTSILCPVPFLAAVVARVAVVLAVAPAGALLLIVRPVLVASFAGSRL
jgi:hypothetical protein